MSMNEQPMHVQPITEENAFMEKLLRMRAGNPKSFSTLSPSMKLSLLHYEAGRREHFRLESIKNKEEEMA